MKLLSKLICLLFFNDAFAAQIIIYYPTSEHKDAAITLKSIFEKDYQIPQKLVSIKNSSKCISKEKRFLEVCIENNWRLRKIDNKRTEEIVRSLLIFSKNQEV